VTVANKADPAIPKRVSLPSMFPPDCVAVAALSTPSVARMGCLPVRRVGDKDPDQEHQGHRGEQRPALPGVLDHVSERIGEARAEHEDQEHLKEIREGRRTLERVPRVGVEEATAVRAELLDDFLRRDGTLRNRLSRTLDGLDDGVRMEVLDGPCQQKTSAATIEIGIST